MSQNDSDRTIIEHDNRFIIINTRSFEPFGDKPNVLPSECEQVFYFGVLHKLGWLFVVRHDPRGRLIKYHVMEE